MLQGLGSLTGPLKELAAIDAELVEDRDSFAEAVAQLTDLAQRLRAYRDRLEFDPDKLEKVEERLDLVRRLVKKYGGSLGEGVRRGEQGQQGLRELGTGEGGLKGGFPAGAGAPGASAEMGAGPSPPPGQTSN